MLKFLKVGMKNLGILLIFYCFYLNVFRAFDFLDKLLILDTQKSYNDSTEMTSVLPFYITMGHLSKLRNQRWYTVVT